MKFAINLIHHLVISILVFTIWAAFALLIVNPNLHNLPQYIMGSLCIWDFGAMAFAVFVSFIIGKYWGYPKSMIINKKASLVLPINYSYFFLGYFIFALSVGIWQFWLFSQQF